VSADEGRKLAEQWKCYFTEASAKKNESVKDVFVGLIGEIDRADRARTGASGAQDSTCAFM
jgi:hypothetical protein